MKRKIYVLIFHIVIFYFKISWKFWLRKFIFYIWYNILLDEDFCLAKNLHKFLNEKNCIKIWCKNVIALGRNLWYIFVWLS